jgi:hypothetical protein
MDFRLTAALLVVLAVLGGVVWFTEFRDKGGAAATSTPADKQKPEVFKFEDRDTKLIEVVKGDQTVRVEKDQQGEWTLQPSGLPGDRLRISSVLSRLSSLQATRVVTDAPSDLGQYGLASPALSATVTQTDGSSYTLQAGSKGPTETGTYAQKAGEPQVFLVQNQLVTDLERLVNEPPIQQPTSTPAPTSAPSPTP